MRGDRQVVEPVPSARPGRQSSPRRTWAIVALLSSGTSLLLVAVAGAHFLWIDGAVNYRYWPADGHIVGGDGAQVVEVDAGEEFLLWKFSTDDSPECSVREAPSGDVVVLEDVDERWERGAGAVPFVAFARGTSAADRVKVSCEATALSSFYLDHPSGPRLIDFWGPWWWLPLAGGVAAIALVVGGALVPRRGRSRHRS